jgi:arylsulfatase A-like enzyme
MLKRLPPVLLLSLASLACGGVPAARPNVILYLVDTLRADHLGCYGSSRGTSPHLDAFAGESALFEAATAQSSWTRPAVTSIFTGLYPRTHGVQQRLQKVPLALELLPELLRRDGYQTAGFVSSAVVTAQFGFGQGFDLLDQREKERIEPTRPTSEWVYEQAAGWLSRRDPRRPFFLFLHVLDPHMPYTPPEPFRRRLAAGVDPGAGSKERVVALRDGTMPSSPADRAELAALYDAEIAAQDAAFGRLIRRLRELNLYDRVLLIFVADHGEEFLDHGGWEHGATLYQEQLHVPFLLKHPEGLGAGRRIAALVRQVDVLPTILDTLGSEAPPGIEGRSLVPLLRGAGVSALPAFASLDLDGRRIESVELGGRKLIQTLAHDRLPEQTELFDLAADPAERHDLADEDPVATRRLLALLERPRRAPEIEQVPLDPELERQLRALGYLKGTDRAPR